MVISYSITGVWEGDAKGVTVCASFAIIYWLDNNGTTNSKKFLRILNCGHQSNQREVLYGDLM